MRLWYVELGREAQAYLKESTVVHSMHPTEHAAARTTRALMQRIIDAHPNPERLTIGPPAAGNYRDLGFAVYEDVGNRYGPNHNQHRLRYRALVRSKIVQEESAIDLLARLA